MLLNIQKLLYFCKHVFLVADDIVANLCLTDVFDCLWYLHARKLIQLIDKFEIRLLVICTVDCIHNASRKLVWACCTCDHSWCCIASLLHILVIYRCCYGCMGIHDVLIGLIYTLDRSGCLCLRCIISVEVCQLLLHIICEYVEYEEGTYDQTAYSAVMQKKTVCAGYAKLYSMLTNAAGLETVSVTSATHGWNRTKLGNQWYNVDLTWDDGTPISYQFFNKSDATMEKYDGSSRESHTQNHYYDGVAPGCESDYGASVTVVDAEQIHADTATVVLDLVNNQSGQIRTSFVPANVTDKRLGYVSENTNIATVSASGLVTAVAPGKTSITIRKLTNNQKAACTIVCS